jgi:ribosome modulation factor
MKQRTLNYDQVPQHGGKAQKRAWFEGYQSGLNCLSKRSCPYKDEQDRGGFRRAWLAGFQWGSDEINTLLRLVTP